MNQFLKALGGTKMEKSKYNSLMEWKKYDLNAYQAADRKGLIDEICIHFGWEKRKGSRWTLSKILDECKKYKNFTELAKNNRSMIECAKAKGLSHEIYSFFNIEKKTNLKKVPSNYWTLEKCKEDALKYNTKVEWERSRSGSYNNSRRKGWYYECTKHMENLIKIRGYWTLEKCKEDALKYNTREEWKKSYSAHNSARRNGWIDECTKHMGKKRKPAGYWNKEKCLEESRKYKSTGSWCKEHQTSFNSAKKNKWFDECCSHMKIKTRKHSGYWTLEKCQEDALKYTSRKEWNKSNIGAYNSARKNNWLDECCGHMK